MGISMDNFITQGKSDVTDKLKEAQEQASDIGKDVESVKSNLEDLPDGLDPDLAQGLKDTVEQTRDMGLSDISQLESSIVSDAKNTASDIISGVNDKISDNNTTIGKLDNIDSRYAKGERDNMRTAITDNSQKGESLISELENILDSTDTAFQDIKTGI